MENERPEPVSKVEQGGKKAYRKPGLQVYGTLSQVTGASAQPAAHTNDPGLQPGSQPAPNTNRT